MNTSSSVITCGGLWTRGTNGIFIHGSGTVVFNSGSGSATITPLSSSFYNVSFNNAGTTFYLTGATLNILNEFQIVSGTVNPATNNYTYNIGGSFNNQGTFNPITGGVTAGTVILNGASDQQITRGRFYNLTVSGSNIKYTNDTLIVTNTTAVNSTLRANAGSVHDFNGNMTIAAAGTYHDGGGNHTFAGTGWTCAGTYTGTGTITFDRTTAAQVINSGSFYNLVVACTGQIFQVTTNITVNNNLTFKNGIAYASLTGTISNPGSGTFTVENAVNIYVLGTNCFPSGFLTYSLDPTCFTRYQGTSDQTILGVTYGNLVLQNANVKTLSGDIAVLGTLYLNTTGITFDVSPNNYNISLAGNWTAQGGANTTFNCRQGEVLFNGAGTQDITYDATATNNFYDITVNKSAGSVRTTSNVPYTIQNNLTVSSGTFDPWGRTITIGGNLNNVGGTIVTSGTFNLNKASGSAIIRSNGSVFNNLTINSAGGATYTAQDNMSLVNNFNLTAGTFDGNGRTVSLGDWNTDVVNIAGTYKIGAGGRLTLGNGTSLTIGNTGRFEAIGTAGNVAVVSRNASGGSYNFLVNGTIAARYYLFEYMNSAGIFVNNTATIDATNNFSNGTFTNGSNNGIYLRVENTQSFTDPNYITDVAFPVVPAGSSFTVRKISARSGTLEFYSSTGTFAGATTYDDPAALLSWTAPITLPWIGSQNTDWNQALDWTPSNRPAIVPTGAEHGIIAAAVNQPILTTFGAMTSNLTINTGATLTLNTPADASENDLTVNGDVTINGTLRLNTINDYMSVGGSWIKAAAGTVVCNGNVTFNGTSGGAKTINNGVATFYNLTISGTNLYQLGVSTTIRNNIVIDAGASFDVTTAPYNLIIGGSWTNNGTFLAQTGKVTFNTTAGPLNITSGSSSFYDIDINAASQTYRLAGTMSLNHNLNVIAGTLDLNSNILNVGDGNGVDYLTITGILETDGSSSLRMGANSVVQVNSGGTLKLLGSSLSNRAIMTRQSAGNYSVTINSGGNIWARYYNIEYTNTNGVYMMSGSLLNSSNNFSDGTFANGQAGGRYLRFENEFGGDITIANVVFGAGPSYNVTRTSGTDQVIMQDISGAIGTYLNEEDMGGVVDANIGMLLWTYMNTFTWTGNVDTDWHTGGNWSSGIVPNNTKDAIIPNVTNKPVISTGAAEANRITIYTGSSLTVSNQNLTVTQDIFYSGTITATGTPVITIGDNWTSSGGSFSPGNSRVVLNAATGTKTISVGASQFYDLTINTGGTYSLSGNTTIQHNLTINSGTLNSNGFDLYVGGSWSNSGTFTQGTRTITFNGSSGTHSINNGLGSLYNLTITGTATYQLASALTLTNNYTQTNGTFDLSNDGGVTSNNLIIGNRFYSVGGNVFARAATIQVGENFTILGTGSFTCGTSTLRMTSTSGTRSVGPRTSALYNLTLAGTTTFRPANNLDINGTLTINASNTLDMVTPVSYNLNIAGNMTVLGTFLAQNSVVTFDGADQSFTNSSVQTFYRVTLNNTGTLTLASNHIIVSNGLTMTAGRINTGTYKLTLGTSTANIGTLTYTAGTIIGKFERWMNNIGTAYIFPVGTATNNNRITVTCVAGLTSGSLITEFLSGDPGSSGMPLTESSRLINQQFTDGYWNITAANSLACTNYNVTLNGTGFASYTIDAETRVLKRTNDGAWSLEGTHVAAATPNCYRNALNGISTLGTQLGFGRSNCAMPVFTLQPSNSTICAGSNTTFVITATGTTLSYQWQLSTDGGGSWANQADGGVYSGMTTATMTITAALAGMDSYQYRCIITDICLQTATSNVATLTVNSLPAVTVQPLNQTVCVSAVATFTVNATGTGVS